MTAYYNEIDPAQAARLRALIKLKMIADGEVDERSIEDIRPSELGGFTQCHFFAGIGGWSRALRLAGWPDDRPVWTGSCPCQSFSAAGQGKGFADERHLWPAWFHLIGEREPPVIFGEQVDAAIKHGWLDLVQTDLEAAGYAIGHAVIPAASVGAPHGRHRLWFVANSTHTDRRRRSWFEKERVRQDQERRFGSASDSAVESLADTLHAGRAERQTIAGHRSAAGCGELGGVAIANLPSEHERSPGWQQSVRDQCHAQRKTNGFWLDADWIPCRDGKWRAIQKPESEFLLLDDGLFYRLDSVISEHIKETALAVTHHAENSRSSPSEIMQMVQDAFNSESFQRATGGQNRFPEPEVLLGFLRDVLSACDRTTDSGGGAKASAEDDPRMLRDLHEYVKASCASHRRESKEQFSGEPSNSLQQLSWFLARCCKTRWDYEARAYASNFPLSGYVKGRMDLLRGFGNAIVAQQAAAFIEAST